MRADAGMPGGEALMMRAHHRVHRGGTLDEVIFLIHVHCRHGCGKHMGGSNR